MSKDKKTGVSTDSSIKVSVLVPIFNVQKYLTKCLESLKNQSLKGIEFICINDGSTDNSLKILNGFAKEDDRFVVINKDNSGYGDSMNRGLEKARGKYIGILESDDFIDENAFQELYKLAESHDADIVRANYYYHSNDSDEVHKSIKEQKLGEALDILDDTSILYEEPAIWSAIYKRSFLTDNNIRFLPTPGASYQDTSFNFKALCSAKRIVYTNKAYLHYRTDNSNSSVKSLEKVLCVTKEFEEIEKYLGVKKLDKKLKYIAQAAKFGAYHWNLQRLDKKNGLEFAKRMKREFGAATEKDLIKKAYFPKKYWIALQAILKMPIGVAFSLLYLRKKLHKN